MSARVTGRPSPVAARIVVAVVGGLFLIPLVAMLEFTLRQTAGGYGLEHWAALFDPENARRYRTLFQGIGNSFALAAIALAIVLVLFFPTIVLVHLRFPRLERGLDLLTVLPIAIPAIVLVVGFAPVYRVIGQLFGSGAWTLGLAYGVLVLPFAYRAIHGNLTGVDVRTLAEAARSLGAGWGTVIARILLPNIRRGLLAASVIACAVVLGEFTIASLLNRNNLQTALLVIQASDPFIAIIFTLLALAFAFGLLLILGRAGATTRRRK